MPCVGSVCALTLSLFSLQYSAHSFIRFTLGTETTQSYEAHFPLPVGPNPEAVAQVREMMSKLRSCISYEPCQLLADPCAYNLLRLRCCQCAL